MEGARKFKVEEQIRETVARLIERESNKTALITVTRVELYDKGRNATIFFTTMPESGEASALNFLKRQRKELRAEIKQHLNLHTIPFLEVKIDKGEKARQTIDALLKE